MMLIEIKGGLRRHAVRAPAEYGDVVWIDGKSQLTLGLACQILEQLVLRLDTLAALIADEVGVGVGCQLVGDRPVTEVRVGDDAQLLQLLKVPVDGGEMDVG
jgi:hypothetical protein